MERTSPQLQTCWTTPTRRNLLGAVLLVLFSGLILSRPSAHALDGVSRQAFVQELSLAHNSPNPFNANTTINYSLLVDSQVRVDIYDLRGRMVETLLDVQQLAGDNFAIWKTESAPSGTYFFCLTVEEIKVFGKMSLVK